MSEEIKIPKMVTTFEFPDTAPGTKITIETTGKVEGFDLGKFLASVIAKAFK